MTMRGETQSDATPHKRAFRIWISYALAGLIGVTIGAILIFCLAPGLFTFESRCYIASHTISGVGLSSAKVDPIWHMTIRSMVDSAAQQAETRLRDHFTMLLAMAGMGTAVILAIFSLSQARREEQAISEMKELRTEAKNILTEIRQCGETAHTEVDKIKEGFEKLRRSPATGPEEKREGTSRDSQFGAEEQKSEKDGSSGEKNKETPDVLFPPPPSASEVEQPAPTAGTPEASVQVNQTDLEQLQTFAAHGDAEAQVILAQLYRTGQDIGQNKAEAAKWYKKAAEKGHAMAQFNLGVMYSQGDGIEQNKAEATKWYKKAAEQGLARAQFNLAIMYDEDDGIEQNKAEAAKWYKKAAEQGLSRAQFNLGVMYSQGDGIEQSKIEAEKWYIKAAEQGHIKAQFNLAVMYSIGDGIEQDKAEAEKWYIKAAEQGNAKAQFNLAVMYDKGDGVNPDQRTAVSWYQKAAEQRHAPAALEMASRYFNGKGVPENYIKAYVFLLLYKASKSEDKNASLAQNLQQSLANLLPPEQIAAAQREATALWNKIDNTRDD